MNSKSPCILRKPFPTKCEIHMMKQSGVWNNIYRSTTMRLVTVFIICLFLVSAGIGWILYTKENSSQTWETMTPQLSELVDIDESVETLANGFFWVEGPAWSKEDHVLLFSDIPANIIYRWDEESGVSEYLKESGYSGIESFNGREPGSNGLVFDNENRLIITEHGDREISRREHDGSVVTIIDRYQGKRLNSPNDVIVTKGGDILFTDPPYGLPQVLRDPNKELPFQGVYRWDGQTLFLLTDALKFPNGLGLSPDEKTLYVTNSGPDNLAWYAFDFDGTTLSNQRVLLDGNKWAGKRQGAPDGFCVDDKGNIFSSGPGGLYVISPDGEVLGFLHFKHPVSNCTWGGEDLSELFITGKDSLYRLKTKTKGSL